MTALLYTSFSLRNDILDAPDLSRFQLVDMLHCHTCSYCKMNIHLAIKSCDMYRIRIDFGVHEVFDDTKSYTDDSHDTESYIEETERCRRDGNHCQAKASVIESQIEVISLNGAT